MTPHIPDEFVRADVLHEIDQARHDIRHLAIMFGHMERWVEALDKENELLKAELRDVKDQQAQLRAVVG